MTQLQRQLQKRARVAFMLSVWLIVQLLFGMPAKPAAAALTENLVSNPGFENTTNNVPADWVAIDNSWNAGIKAENQAARTGNYGVSIQTHTGNNPWVAIPVPVEEGATYEISSWFKSIGVTGSPGYKLEFLKGMNNTEANWIAGQVYQASTNDNDGQWHELKYEVQAPPQATYVYLYLRLYGVGSVYFDDISVIKTKNKPQIVVDSAQRYYYPEITSGSVGVRLEPQDGILTGKTIDIRIVNEQAETVLFEQNGIAASGQLNIAFGTTNMVLQQPYRIEAELKDNQSQVIESAEQTIYRWARPTSLPENGPILVDGQPFFPVIAYHAGPEDYPYLQSIGVNTVQGTNTTDAQTLEAELDAAHANGLKMLIALYSGMQVKENAEMTEEFVTSFKDHPAVLGYMIMDEPSTNGIPHSELIDAYHLIRSIDPAHPIYMTEEDPNAYRQTGQATDILVTDVYPLRQTGGLPLKSVGEGVRQAVASVGDNKPVWTILQTSTYSDTIWTVLPTEAQLRNMAYQAILSGAKGLGYYAIHDPGWNLWNSEMLPVMTAFKDELALIGDLVTAGEKVNEQVDSNVQWAYYSKGQEQYAIAINLTQQTQTVTIPLAQAGNEIELLYDAQSGTVQNWLQEMTIALAAEQTLVYRIKPLVAKIYNPGFEQQAAAENAPDGWSLYNGAWDAAMKHSGQYAVKLVPDANDPFNVLNTHLTRGIKVIPGQKYELSGWVKNSATAGSVALGIREVDASGVSVTYTWTEAAQNSDWTKLDVTFTAQPNTKTIWVYLKMDQAANGPAWLDDLELIDVTNPVYNPGFEQRAGAENTPDGWSLYNAVWDSAVKHSGQYAAKLLPDANDPFNVLNTHQSRGIKVISSQQYKLSGWVKNSATAGSVALGVREVDASGVSVTYTWTEAEQDSDWTKLGVTFTAQPNTKTIWVYLKMDQAANAPAWLDDLELSEVS